MPNLGGTFNARDELPKPLPEGRYPAMITKIEDKPTSKGGEMSKVFFKSWTARIKAGSSPPISTSSTPTRTRSAWPAMSWPISSWPAAWRKSKTCQSCITFRLPFP
jgi:hypothetical protein